MACRRCCTSALPGPVHRALLSPTLWLSPRVRAARWVWLGVGTRFRRCRRDGRTWGVLSLLYCFAASLAPMWSPSTPRYLGGSSVHGWQSAYWEFFRRFAIQKPFQDLACARRYRVAVPLLFGTIACGPSGFNGWSSGTTSKQIAKESTAVGGYGACSWKASCVDRPSTVMIATTRVCWQGPAPPTARASDSS